jgi:SAM-dependent methyltransferase
LEFGCGTGGNLALLSGYVELYAIEPNETARASAEKRRVARIQPGSLPDELPYNEPIFDLVVMTDVLEHVEDDFQALLGFRHLLKEKGYMVVTVPACPFLWGDHDNLHHHKRRYTKITLSEIFLNAGYSIQFISYINTILFPFIAVRRIFNSLLGVAGGDDLRMPPTFINGLLERIFASARHVFKLSLLPFGVSLILLTTKRGPQHRC